MIIFNKHIWLFLAFFQICGQVAFAQNSENIIADTESYKSWISQMKLEDRGPFSGIKWFCNDGSVRPAKSPCPGVQHGQWSDRTLSLRSYGYSIANLFTMLTARDYDRFISNPRELAKVLLERFLVTYDDGWIFRKARYYRGAFQVEDEIEAAKRLLNVLVGEEDLRENYYLLLREAARLLPRDNDFELLTRIRALASRLARSERGFVNITNKIHSYPDAGDAERTRNYLYSHSRSKNAADFELLASLIDRFYKIPPIEPFLLKMRENASSSEVEDGLDLALERLTQADTPFKQCDLYADLMSLLRDEVAKADDVDQIIAMLDLSQAIERIIFSLREEIKADWSSLSRKEHVEYLERYVKILYGTGLLSNRAYSAARAAVQNFFEDKSQTLKDYYDLLQYLSLVPSWATGQVEWLFGDAIKKFFEIEPLASDYLPDRLRTSPLLFFSEHIGFVVDDASRELGIAHNLFGEKVLTGLKVLNPGLGRGILLGADTQNTGSNPPIYFVPETVADLSAAAGILTARSGNALSHVQILARNLGVPNVVVSEKLLSVLERRIGSRIIVAASPGGRVEISDDSSKWQKIFASESNNLAEKIDPDLDKLDLDFQEFISLAKLRKRDSGRIVGPKAAKLAVLKENYPGAVTHGVAIPFGIFYETLNSVEIEGSSLFDWIKREYKNLAALKKSGDYQQELEFTLTRIRQAIEGINFPESFKTRLREAMEQEIGPVGSYGVFVRSDTNIEDLPNFTGAGLNLTLPNVVDFEEILTSIKKVWASPFTSRSFSWRQDLMTKPEHVYVSVLLLRTAPVEKSGVLITRNVETGDEDHFTVAVNEGIGGVVNNQTAETILIDKKTAQIKLLAEASTTGKRVADLEDGLKEVETTRNSNILNSDEIKTLYNFVVDLPDKLDDLDEASDSDETADVEFGFIKGKLVLFQIRPYIYNKRATKNEYLVSLDKNNVAHDKGKGFMQGFLEEQIQ